MNKTTNPCEYGPPRTHEQYASILIEMSAFHIAFGVCLILGGVVSILPQHYKIWSTKSSAGISYLWLFLGQIGQVSSVINAAVLKFPQEHACFVLGLEKCMPSMLTLIQLVAIWAFTFPVYLWYLKFLDPRTLPKQDQRLAKVFFGVLLAFIATVSVISAVLIIFAGECAKATKSWGYAMGLVATAITFVQWSPQIYATFRRKSVGSFSILMLCIQCPGAILILYFFIFVSHEGVSTWLSYLSSVTQQLVLLAMLVYYDRKNKRGDMSVNQEERQTLLPPLEESTLKESSLKD